MQGSFKSKFMDEIEYLLMSFETVNNSVNSFKDCFIDAAFKNTRFHEETKNFDLEFKSRNNEADLQGKRWLF